MSTYDNEYDRKPRGPRPDYGDLPPPPPGPPHSNLGGEPMPNERRPRQARYGSNNNLPPPPMGDALNERPSAMKREGSRNRVPADMRPEFPDEASYLGSTAPDIERKNRKKDREFRDKRDGYESDEGETLRNHKPRRSPRPPEDADFLPRRPRVHRARDGSYNMPPPAGAIPDGEAPRKGYPPPGATPVEPHRRGPEGDRPRRRDRDYPDDDAPPRRRRDDDYDARQRRRRDDYDDYDDPPPRRPRDRPVEYGSDPIPARRRNTNPDRPPRPRRREYDDYSDDDPPPPRRHRSQVERRPRRDPYDDRYYDSDDRDRRRPARDDRDRRRYSDEYDDYDRRDRRGDRDRKKQPKSIKIGDYDIGPMLDQGKKHYASVAPIVTPFIINAAKKYMQSR